MKDNSSNRAERFREAASSLCGRLCAELLPYSDIIGGSANEIRLRLDRPLGIVCAADTYYPAENYSLTKNCGKGSLICTKADLENTFHKLCDYSLYARQREINSGFVTIRGGHRAGVCGTAVFSGGALQNVRHITSVNIRIAREHKGCSHVLFERIAPSEGLLICGSPCSGKTTLLRDIARYISYHENKRVSVIDERGELAAKSGGAFQNDMGMCDVFDGYPKPEGIMQALRCMSPDVVVCDEIGSEADADALALCACSGVKVIATVHASAPEELLKKKAVSRAVGLGVFPHIVYLSGRGQAGRIAKITDGERHVD